LALVQTTGRVAFGNRNPERRIIDKKKVWVACAETYSKIIPNQRILNAEKC
jgi:hypothetical protein